VEEEEEEEEEERYAVMINAINNNTGRINNISSLCSEIPRLIG
jgi:hypothetical protein